MGAFSVPGGGGDGCSVQAQSRTIQRQAVRKRESDFFHMMLLSLGSPSGEKNMISPLVS